MSMVLEMCPIFVRKYIIILKLVLGDGIPKFVMWVSVGVCGYDMEVGWEMRAIFLRKLLNNTKIGIG